MTVRGRQEIIVRGHKNATYRVCPTCHRTFYFASGSSYLYPEPPANVAIFESQLSGFVVPVEIYERQIAQKTWRAVYIESLPVLDPPPDGLGVIPA